MGGERLPPYPHCVSFPVGHSELGGILKIGLLNTGQLLQLRHHQKAEISSSLKGPTGGAEPYERHEVRSCREVLQREFKRNLGTV